MKVGVTLSAALFAVKAAVASPAHFADADNRALVTAGGTVYMTTCSSCHGRRLQGQALWQVMDQYAGRRAPAQDATGHSWQHSDEDLFRMTKFGRFPSAPPRAVSYMPAFAGHLSDHEILAVLAFIKSSWPIGVRASQAMLNPGSAGMPKNLGSATWTLPPNCTGSSFLQWSTGEK
ncbi:MAG TPA: cytochrome c [Rhizomicrobium sp.]